MWEGKRDKGTRGGGEWKQGAEDQETRRGETRGPGDVGADLCVCPGSGMQRGQVQALVSWCILEGRDDGVKAGAVEKRVSLR